MKTEMNLCASFAVMLAKKRVTNEQVAKDLHVAPENISRWKTQSFPASRLQEVSDYFEIKPSEFVAIGEG